MFNFLNSSVLFAAAAALIPLILHLFSKRRVKVIEFSSLRHLTAMQKRQVRRLKIRQLLLLALRMLIILAVVIAFARPTTEGGNIGSHAAVSAVIIVDNSGSMDRYVADGKLFDIARQRTTELLETFSDVDEVALVPLIHRQTGSELPLFSSATIASEKLQRLSVSYATANFGQILENSVMLLERGSNLNREIYLVCDRQRSALPERILLDKTDANVYLVDLPIEDNVNSGITSIDFGGQLIIPGHDFDLTATVHNYGGEDRNDLIVSLFIDGRRVAQTDARAEGGDDAVVRFTQSVSRTGFHSGYVELSDDKFSADNRYYFSFTIPESFNLLVIRGDNAAPLLSLALAPSSDINQYWSVKEADADELAGINFFDYDVIFLSGTPKLRENYVNRLKAFVEYGRSLLLTYGPDTDIDQFNSKWSSAAGLFVDEHIRTDFTRAGYYTLSSFDIEHPVFSVFGLDQTDPPLLKFYTLPKVHTISGARTIARFSGDRPALIENDYGRGKILTFAGPLGPEFTDLSGHAFFVPLIARIAEYLASDLSSYETVLYCGDDITRTPADAGTSGTVLDLVTPDSVVYTVSPQDDHGVAALHISQTYQPGVYRLNDRGREIDRFAVNVRPEECDLTALDRDQFAAALGAKKFHLLEMQTSMAGLISEFRFGKELWQLFLWIAALLLIVEMLLARGMTSEDEQ